ncbi:50S ribosomal protein L17 [Calditrichota bacterium]
MRHLSNSVHLNRTAAHRKALFSNLSAALIMHKRIVTTLPKAKYTRGYIERMITFARKGDFAARRHVARTLRNPEALKRLFDEIGPHFQNRNGGYTRIIKLGPRKGDAAPMAILEFVGFDDADLTQLSKTTTKKSKPKKQDKLEVDGAEIKDDVAVSDLVEVADTEETKEVSVDAATGDVKTEPEEAVTDSVVEIAAETPEVDPVIEASDTEEVADVTSPDAGDEGENKEVTPTEEPPSASEEEKSKDN